MNSKAIKKQLLAAVAMVLVAAVALGSSTYAWFVNNTVVNAQTVTLNATTANALYISAAAVGNTSGWTTTHNFANSTKGTLVPVSTTGKNTEGEAMKFWKSNAWEINDSHGSKNEVISYTAATANTDYYMDSFEIKASQACKLAIDMDTTSLGSTSETMKAVMRLALVVTDSKGENAKYFFYTLDDGAGLEGSVNTTFNGTAGADGITKAIKDGSKEKADAVDVISADNLSSGATGGVKQLAGVSGANPTQLNILGENDMLFEFKKPNDVCKVTAYVWMEGCDYDTIGANLTAITGTGNTLTLNLGFCACAAG